MTICDNGRHRWLGESSQRLDQTNGFEAAVTEQALSLALSIVGGIGVAITLFILSGDIEGGRSRGGTSCFTPPTDTEVGDGSDDVEGVGCLVGDGAVDRVLGVVLKRPAES